MYYFTIKQPQKWEQIDVEEFLNGVVPELVSYDSTGTITYEKAYISAQRRNTINVADLIDKLRAFNSMVEPLRSVPRRSLYREFTIPKKSGGRRKIDAPNDMLKAALRALKDMFENEFQVLYHTSAYAYIKGRSVVGAMKKHQENESKWFAKYDFTNFFGSITFEFAMEMLSRIFPFCCIVEHPAGREELEKAIELGFLDGGLPQGTPLSPTLTNILMIPIDYRINKALREKHNAFCCTRYADDFQISSRYTFDFREIESLICDTLKEFDAPMKIKPEKTRYGSSSGANWNLGLMLNRDNNLTVGHRRKKAFQAALASFIMDTENGHPWNPSEVRVLDGNRNYYRQIEGEAIDRIVAHVGNKFGVDVNVMIKNAISGNVTYMPESNGGFGKFEGFKTDSEDDGVIPF